MQLGDSEGEVLCPWGTAVVTVRVGIELRSASSAGALHSCHYSIITATMETQGRVSTDKVSQETADGLCWTRQEGAYLPGASAIPYGARSHSWFL